MDCVNYAAQARYGAAPDSATLFAKFRSTFLELYPSSRARSLPTLIIRLPALFYIIESRSLCLRLNFPARNAYNEFNELRWTDYYIEEGDCTPQSYFVQSARVCTSKLYVSVSGREIHDNMKYLPVGRIIELNETFIYGIVI